MGINSPGKSTQKGRGKSWKTTFGTLCAPCVTYHFNFRGSAAGPHCAGSTPNLHSRLMLHACHGVRRVASTFKHLARSVIIIIRLLLLSWQVTICSWADSVSIGRPWGLHCCRLYCSSRMFTMMSRLHPVIHRVILVIYDMRCESLNICFLQTYVYVIKYILLLIVWLYARYVCIITLYMSMLYKIAFHIFADYYA